MFKTTFVRVAAALTIVLVGAGSVYAHGGATARHGGVAQFANHLSFELVARAEGAVVYVEDHGKPLATAGMSGKLSVLNGTERSEADLVAVESRLEAKGIKLTKGARVVAAITTADRKVITVRFVMK